MVEPWPSTDTPEGVVRAARAILKSRFYDCEPTAYASMSEFWQSIYRNDHWIEAEWEARAVIEALMEPTPDQISAGYDALRSAGEKPVTAMYQTMLRTALSKPNDEGEGK